MSQVGRDMSRGTGPGAALLRAGRVLAAMWRLGLAEAVAYRAAMLVWILTTTFPLVSLALWYSLAADGPIGDYGRADFVAYFVAAFLIRQLTASWVVWDLSAQIASGDLSTLLMRPVHPLLHHLMQNLAALPVRMALALPLGVLVLVLAGGISAAPGLHLLLVPLAVVLAWLLGLCVQTCVACLAFWVTSSTSLFEVWLGLYMVLSGYAVPTSLFPAGLVAVVRYLPFHASLGFPVELTIGRLSGPEIAAGFATQVVWLVLFGGLARWLWRRGLRAYGAVGA
ncbi:ABC-2 family transporter protein [Nannocystis sp.]|uniref:ABC transporter permease n=1 Tax=Nannocystis sp. TaxID=1962667 RepID=UPI0025E1FA44|nr:ABC-2 family transporter protein [Nannocystis sp.]MBK7827845.1 ABC-2 family transporter protein [Nannocystis sp.]